MPDRDDSLESDDGRRRRTSTRLSAVGSLRLVPPLARDVAGRATSPAARTIMIGRRDLERSDITEGKAGIPLMLILSIVEAADGFRPIAGAAVEIWHCDADGVYSDYASQVDPRSARTTYLRGVQTTDGAGRVIFRTIYPGWSGRRAAHAYVRIHDGARPTRTVQLGFPDAVNAAVHGDAERYVKGRNPIRNAADPVFGGAAGHGADDRRLDCQIAPVAGNNANGYVAMVEIPVKRFC